MGGVLMLFSISVSCLLWGNLQQVNLWLVLMVTLGYGLIGWVDDYRKLVLKNSQGLPARWKYFWQSVIACLAVAYLYSHASLPIHTQLTIPFFKSWVVQLGFLFPILAYFVIVGSSNAVNLTDGLDGLAIMPIVMVAGALGVFAYASSNVMYAHYLSMPFVPQTGELTIFCSSIVGAGLGFLWYNSYPAQIFMGDVGSLPLGGLIAAFAIYLNQEILLVFYGGIFVVEVLSVILQVYYFKRTKTRIFHCAPLHHHYQFKGWSENKIVYRFALAQTMCAFLGIFIYFLARTYA